MNEVPTERATIIHSYITKAVCSQGHPTMEHWVNKVQKFSQTMLIRQSLINFPQF